MYDELFGRKSNCKIGVKGIWMKRSVNWLTKDDAYQENFIEDKRIKEMND